MMGPHSDPLIFTASREITTEEGKRLFQHNCIDEVRPKFRDGQIDRKVLEALKASGLTMDQCLDALNNMRCAGIIFGVLEMNGCLSVKEGIAPFGTAELMTETRYSSTATFKRYISRSNASSVLGFQVQGSNLERVRMLWKCPTADAGDYIVKAGNNPHVVVKKIDFEARYRRPH